MGILVGAGLPVFRVGVWTSVYGQMKSQKRVEVSYYLKNFKRCFYETLLNQLGPKSS